MRNKDRIIQRLVPDFSLPAWPIYPETSLRISLEFLWANFYRLERLFFILFMDECKYVWVEFATKGFYWKAVVASLIHRRCGFSNLILVGVLSEKVWQMYIFLRFGKCIFEVWKMYFWRGTIRGSRLAAFCPQMSRCFSRSLGAGQASHIALNDLQLTIYDWCNALARALIGSSQGCFSTKVFLLQFCDERITVSSSS